MSKSYDNIVPIFAEPSEVRRKVMSIITDSRRPEEPKDPDSCNVFKLYRHLAAPQDVRELANRYRQGGIGYGEAKNLVVEAHEVRFGQAYARYQSLIDRPQQLQQILADGAERARDQCRDLLAATRAATGVLGAV